MKCSNCGAELTEDTKFCSYCGKKVTDSSSEIPKADEAFTASAPFVEPAQKKSAAGAKLITPIDKLFALWRGLDLFGKVLTVSIVGIAILLLTSIIAGKVFAIFISIFQLAGLIVAVLMHNDVIKLNAKTTWIKFFVFTIAILLTVLNLLSYSLESMKTDSTNAGSITVKAPYSAVECAGQDYSTIESGFISAGFTSVKIEKIEDLKPSDSDKVNTVESISVDGETEFDKGQEFNSSDNVVIRYHAYETYKLVIHVDFTKNLIFSTYDVKLLLNGVEKGTMEHGESKDFELTVDPGDYILAFVNTESSSVKGEVALKVDCDIDAVYKIYCHSDEVSVETVSFDRLVELPAGMVKLNVSASEYTHKNYAEVETALKSIGFTNIKYEVLYDIIFGITDDGEVESVSIAGNKEFKKNDVYASDAEIIITYHMPKKADPSKITMPKGYSEYKGQNYVDVQQALKDLGFTNITLSEVSEDNTSYTDGEVFLVDIGGLLFDAGDIFDPDDKVCIKYYHIVESKPAAPFHSTNNYEIAKKGNTGVFSYVDYGHSYDIYWIIDFDEGYVYYFMDGDGDNSCDRLKIESGTLNDEIIITYHDGVDEWSYKFHFKNANQPETLIMIDNDGFDYTYTTVNLADALSIRNKKEIKDF